MKQRNERGFSLLEVIVAVAILGIGFISVIQVFSQSMRSTHLSEQYMKAALLARQQMTRLELADYRVSPPGGLFENEESYRWDVLTAPYESLLNRELEDIRIYQVVLRVSWTDNGRPHSLDITTLKTLTETYPASDLLATGKSQKGSGGGGKDTAALGGGAGGGAAASGLTGGSSGLIYGGGGSSPGGSIFGGGAGAGAAFGIGGGGGGGSGGAAHISGGH